MSPEWFSVREEGEDHPCRWTEGRKGAGTNNGESGKLRKLLNCWYIGEITSSLINGPVGNRSETFALRCSFAKVYCNV